MLTLDRKNRDDSESARLNAGLNARLQGGATSTKGVISTTGLGVVSQALIEQSFPLEWPCASQLLLSFCKSRA